MGNPEENQVNQAIEHRSENAQRLHTLICSAAFAINEDVFANRCTELEKFLGDLDDVTRTNIIMEKAVVSDKNGGHTRNALMDALYLPVESKQSKRLQISDDDRRERAKILFQILSGKIDVEKVKKQSLFVDRNDVTLANYAANCNVETIGLVESFFANVLKGVPDKRFSDAFLAEQWTKITKYGFSLLHHAVITGDEKLYDKVVNKLDDLKKKGIISPETYAAQWTAITKDGFSLLHDAVITGNEALYDKIAAKLDKLPRKTDDEKKAYAAQWTTITKTGFSLLHNAVKQGNERLYNKVAVRLKFLLPQQKEDSHKTYADQWTAITDSGFSILHSALTSTRRTRAHEMLDDICDHLVEIFDGKSDEFKEFLEQETKETKPRNLDDFINMAQGSLNSSNRKNIDLIRSIRDAGKGQQSGHQGSWGDRTSNSKPSGGVPDYPGR